MRRIMLGFEHRIFDGRSKRRFTLCVRLRRRWKYIGLGRWSQPLY